MSKLTTKFDNPVGWLGLAGRAWKNENNCQTTIIIESTQPGAIEEDAACSIYLKKTNIETLELIPIEKLKKFAVDLS